MATPKIDFEAGTRFHEWLRMTALRVFFEPENTFVLRDGNDYWKAKFVEFAEDDAIVLKLTDCSGTGKQYLAAVGESDEDGIAFKRI